MGSNIRIMSIQRQTSKKSLKRSDSSHPDDLDSIPSLTGLRHIGDPVDGIRYKLKEYNFKDAQKVCIDCSKKIETPQDDNPDADEESKDIPKVAAKRSMSRSMSKKSNPKTPVTPVEDATIGFDLMSLSSRRGHFVDHVKPMSKADNSGLKHGDLIREVNGERIRDKSHDEVIKLIRQVSESSETLELTVIHKIETEETLEEEENRDEVDAGVNEMKD